MSWSPQSDSSRTLLPTTPSDAEHEPKTSSGHKPESFLGKVLQTRRARRTAILAVCLFFATAWVVWIGGNHVVQRVKVGSPTPPAEAEQPEQPKQPDESEQQPDTVDFPTDPMKSWGIHSPITELLVGGLLPFPENKDSNKGKPLSPLGLEADNAYHFESSDPAEYAAQLRDFVDHGFSAALRKPLRSMMDTYLTHEPGNGTLPAWDAEDHRSVWQTDKAGESKKSKAVHTWATGAVHREGWEWAFLTDDDAEIFFENELGEPTPAKGSADNTVHYLWDTLPPGILKADLLRYLVLLIKGGIYADTDVKMLKPPSKWGQGATLWNDGKGWLNDDARKRIKAGEDIDQVLGRPSVVVGIEVSVPDDRKDWNNAFPRPLQITQWTMAMAPYHPIAVATVLRVLHATATAAAWSKRRWEQVVSLRKQGKEEEAKKALDANLLNDPNEGPVGIMNWTGPGMWTDTIISYLRARYGVRWTDLRGLKVPLRIGEVVILPMTAFSPGWNGAGPQDDPQAMAYHMFRSSWKAEQDFWGHDVDW